MNEERAKSELEMMEYFQKHHSAHEQECRMYATPSGLLKVCLKEDEDECKALISFMFKTDYGGSRLVIYMPDPSQEKMTGKVVVECSTQTGDEVMYLEITLASVTDFSKIETEYLDTGPWSTIVIFKRIRLARDKAVKFVQELLFDDHFTQRFLMTTSSKVMGSITAQRLRAESGQVLSFRRCVLNE